ncbi:hypothetical protein CASFOL_012147 [Castilleja foliolosa]|uniref:RNase H type-1 domain-containing protein n=1 Tax=Castilleja foliolosa TaxID=1961234 RepID=A0ABD3DTM6_9LAMI
MILLSSAKEILNILGFSDCDHKALHLGLPFCKPSSRTLACQEIGDRICNKLKGWKSKLLSQASGTILIKSLFWWGSNDRGFRRMTDQNLALLSKIAWYLAINKDVLWVSVLKAKYLRGKSFLSDPIPADNSSWLWKDICKCRDWIAKGVVYLVTGNSDISIWSEPWILTITNFIPDPGDFNVSTCATNNPPLFSLLKDLIDNRSLSWNLDKLKSTFSSETVKEITMIQISSGDRPKTLLWCPSKSGKFTIKSFYLFTQSARLSSRLIDLVTIVSKQTKDHWLSIVKTIQTGSSTNQVWKAPPLSWFKINMDSSYIDGVVVSGLVIRNSNGSLLLAAAYKHSCLDPLSAECLSILDACKIIQDLNLHKLSLNLIA